MRPIDADLLGLTDMEIIMCDGDYKEALKMLIDKIEHAPTIEPEREKPEREIEPSCHTCEHLIGQPFKPECSLLGSFVDWGRWKGKAPNNCPLR